MKLKLCNIQFSKISIFRLKKKKSFTDEKLLRIVSLIHWNFSSTDLKNGFGGADSPALKRFIGGASHYKLSYSAHHKRSWIPAFFNLIFDRNFHYYLIIIQSRKWINQKKEEFCN
jgi:hypothetical protein